jgi:hypothetical protein
VALEGTFTQVVVSSGGACAISDQGDLYCWGDMVGRGSPPDAPLEIPRRISHLEPATMVSLTESQLCVADPEGRVHCHLKDPDPNNPPQSFEQQFQF